MSVRRRRGKKIKNIHVKKDALQNEISYSKESWGRWKKKPHTSYYSFLISTFCLQSIKLPETKKCKTNLENAQKKKTKTFYF